MKYLILLLFCVGCATTDRAVALKPCPKCPEQKRCPVYKVCEEDRLSYKLMVRTPECKTFCLTTFHLKWVEGVEFAKSRCEKERAEYKLRIKEMVPETAHLYYFWCEG